jgi:uncharacterized protein (TIGR02466 family)
MNLTISNFSVFPLFPSTLGVTKVEEDISNLQKVKSFEFKETTVAESTSYVTKTYQLFSEFETEKQIIKSYFDRFKNNVLRLENTNFEMTTSWATKCKKGSHSHYHNHKNSFYSGVLYLDDVVQGGELEFANVGIHPTNIMINRSPDVNIFNSETFFISPKKNLLLFFPSYLMHKINTHVEEIPRFSIAFNFMPVGLYGDNDSSIDMQLNSQKFGWKNISII